MLAPNSDVSLILIGWLIQLGHNSSYTAVAFVLYFLTVRILTQPILVAKAAVLSERDSDLGPPFWFDNQSFHQVSLPVVNFWLGQPKIQLHIGIIRQQSVLELPEWNSSSISMCAVL